MDKLKKRVNLFSVRILWGFRLTTVPRPNKKSIKKNKTAHKCDTGNIEIASGYATKANPGPLVATLLTGNPVLWDIKPNTENTTNPANMLVPQFTIGTIIESLKTSKNLSLKKEFKEVLTLYCCCGIG